MILFGLKPKSLLFQHFSSTAIEGPYDMKHPKCLCNINQFRTDGGDELDGAFEAFCRSSCKNGIWNCCSF